MIYQVYFYMEMYAYQIYHRLLSISSYTSWKFHLYHVTNQLNFNLLRWLLHFLPNTTSHICMYLLTYNTHFLNAIPTPASSCLLLTCYWLIAQHLTLLVPHCKHAPSEHQCIAILASHTIIQAACHFTCTLKFCVPHVSETRYQAMTSTAAIWPTRLTIAWGPHISSPQLWQAYQQVAQCTHAHQSLVCVAIAPPIH